MPIDFEIERRRRENREAVPLRKKGPPRKPLAAYALADGVDFDSSSACLVIDGVRISLPFLRSLVATLPLAEALRSAKRPRTGEEQP